MGSLPAPKPAVEAEATPVASPEGGAAVAKPAEPEDPRSAEQIFKDAILAETEESEDEEDTPARPATPAAKGKKKDVKKKGGKPGRERVLIFDEELGRMVPARPNRGDDDFDD